jgi:hypothetical protein
LQRHSAPRYLSVRAVCAALSDLVRRKILILARVPFSDFYFYVLSFNFGAAAAAAPAALAVQTGCRCLPACASPGNFSLFIFLYGCWQTSFAASLTTIQKIFLFACLFLCRLRLRAVPANTCTIHASICIDYNFIRVPLCGEPNRSSAQCGMSRQRT